MSINAYNSNNDAVQKIYCICRSSASNQFMIMCDNCEEWYHGNCIGVTLETAKRIDMFYCNQCSAKNPSLKTTYKAEVNKSKNNLKQVKRKRSKMLKYSKTLQPSRVTADHSTKYRPLKSNLDSTKTDPSCFDNEDTNIRKAKFAENETLKYKDPTEDEVTRKKSKTKTGELKQCYGPGCTKASREGSKYCSDSCGIALGKNRITEILPRRISQWLSTPSAAEELCKKKLTDIRAKLQEIQAQLEVSDMKIIQLIDDIKKAKRPENVFVDLHFEDTTLTDCVLCGSEVPMKSIEKHLEQCYRRQERQIFITERTVIPQDVQWNVFCNQRISRHVYCKKLRVLCPLHYKDSRKDDEVCGYPLSIINGVPTYCGNLGKTCNHVNWEEIQRAELDLDKLNLIVKFNKLKEEEMKIREEMARRGDFLSLMLHETVIH